MLAEKFMKKLKLLGADDVIIEQFKQNSTQIKFYNSKIGVVKNFESESLSLFVTSKKRVLRTNIRELTPQNMNKKARQIMKLVRLLPEKKDYYGIAKGPFKYRKKQGLFEKDVESLGKQIEIVESAINNSLNHGAERVAGVLETSVVEKKLFSSNLVKTSQKESFAYLSIRSLIKKSSGHTTSCSRSLKGLNYKAKSVESAEIAIQGIETRKIPVGKYAIIYYPLASSSIIENIGESASIFNVEIGSSCFSNKINKKVASEIVNISDDPTNNKNPGSTLFDMEGVPTRKNRIIESGILKTYLHNTSTAKKYKTKTTANAGLIAPEVHSLRFGNGDSNLEEMVKTTKKGLIITNTWYTRFQNYAKGDFSTIPRDTILILENGRINGATYGIRINDNIIRMLNNTTMIGKKTEFTLGWETEKVHQIPFFKVENVLITRPK